MQRLWGDGRCNPSVKSCSFFYSALKSKDQKRISLAIKELRVGAASIIDDNIQLAYFMRGAISYHDLMEMTYMERQRVSEFINNRLTEEKEKPAHMPRVY